MVVVRKQAFPPGLLALLLFVVLTGVALYGVLGRVDPAGALTDSPDDLQAYIETADVRLQEASGGNDKAAVLNEANLIQAAADKMLAAEPSDAQRTFAIDAKFKGLSVMIQQDEPGSVDAMQAFVQAHIDDPDPEVAARAAATALGLEITLLGSPQLISEETAGKLARAVNVCLSKSGSLDYNLLQYGLNLIALSEVPQLAAEGYRNMAEQSAIFNASPEVKESFRIRFANAADMMDSIGKPIAFEGTPLDGSPFDWSAYRDKTVLVIFIAAGHEQFLSDLPQLKRLYDFFRDDGFEIVLVSVDDDRDMVEKFVAEQNIAWPMLFSDDPAATGMDHPMAAKYGVQLPMTVILVDRQGNVVCFNAIGRRLVHYLEEEYGPLPEEPAEEPAEDPEAEEPAAEPTAPEPAVDESPVADEPAAAEPAAEGSDSATPASDAAEDSAPPEDAAEPREGEPVEADAAPQVSP